MTPSDQEKIRKVYDEENPKLLAYIRKRIPGNYEPEDILQDVFFQLTRGFNELSRIENLTAWIYRVTNNRIIDLFRKKRYNPVEIYSQDTAGDDGPVSLAEILPDLSSTPEEEELKEIMWDIIAYTLEHLPAAQSEVFILHEFEDMSFKEIAERKGVSVNTLITRKRYAVLELRKKLKSVYEQFNYT